MRRTFTPKFVMLRISSSVATNVFVRAVAIYIFGLLFFFLMCGMTNAQTSLSVGDVQLLGVTADAPDSYAFVLWKDIAAGTLIRVTDNSFTSTAGTTLLNGNAVEVATAIEVNFTLLP